MPPVHVTAVTIGDIFSTIQDNLDETRLRWFTADDINASIQEAYNKIVALLCPIERSTLIPQLSHSYYTFSPMIADFMYVSAIYNPSTNLWLRGTTYREMKDYWQTFQVIGQPAAYDVIDLRRVLIWPFNVVATGVLYVIYKAKAPTISDSHIPLLPHSCAAQLLEYFTMADLMEQAREFSKAKIWWSKLHTTDGSKSVMDQARVEIQSLARMDRELVLEPYRWLFHGGTPNLATWISNETPSGTVNGTNAVFTLAQVPNPTDSLTVQLNGQILYNAEGYNLSGQTITFNSGYIPKVDPFGLSDVIRAWYQVA